MVGKNLSEKNTAHAAGIFYTLHMELVELHDTYCGQLPEEIPAVSFAEFEAALGWTTAERRMEIARLMARQKSSIYLHSIISDEIHQENNGSAEISPAHLGPRAMDEKNGVQRAVHSDSLAL